MSDLNTSIAPTASAKDLWPARFRFFGLSAAALTLAFAQPLLGLVIYAFQNSLHSHALLIPFISAYLIWLRRKEAHPEPSSSPALAFVPLAFGAVALGALRFSGQDKPALMPQDSLALGTFSYLCFLAAAAFLILGGRLIRSFAFPSALLVFVVPMPSMVENGIEIFFQHASAEAAALLLTITGSTVFHDGLIFRLPGISIQVAQECSGIRSTLVLFITSLLAGHMFLSSPWKRSALVLFVIPLAIFRNGFRIFTIAMLCVHVDPSMINSPIHHHGGPVFFILSLIPFFGLLLLLRRREHSNASPGDRVHR